MNTPIWVLVATLFAECVMASIFVINGGISKDNAQWQQLAQQLQQMQQQLQQQRHQQAQQQGGQTFQIGAWNFQPGPNQIPLSVVLEIER
ncbi:unnamed protein product [Cylicocyclus nassatus]|uniref:Uncharacterized protein n=1 Tax=Cylicocyclus nassatus TaxID=53992 RepID=A0AA36M5P2_CYLNA|nr:unnamed protein product [Cylicocyclus nassatus]